jgi:hypothetical protein
MELYKYTFYKQWLILEVDISTTFTQSIRVDNDTMEKVHVRVTSLMVAIVYSLVILG